jgi:rod shape-determining protein MreC
MKMSYLLKNNNFNGGHTNRKKFVITVSVIVLILVFCVPITRNFVFGMGTPVWKLYNFFGSVFQNNIEIVRSKNSLISENSVLKSELEKTKNLSTMNYVLKGENDDLKLILGRKTTGVNFILGAILVKPSWSPYDTLIVDVGSSDGISIGDKVMVDGNVFIGYVSEVFSNTSKIVLYSSPGEKTNVLVGDNNLEKEAVGMGGGNFKIELPREVGVKEGDSIVIPSISPNIFGIVEKISYRETDAFQTLLFKSPSNISELKWVEVITSQKKK